VLYIRRTRRIIEITSVGLGVADAVTVATEVAIGVYVAVLTGDAVIATNGSREVSDVCCWEQARLKNVKPKTRSMK